MTARFKTLYEDQPWRGYNDLRREVLNGASVPINRPIRRAYSRALGRLVPKRENPQKPLPSNFLEIVKSYLRWHYNRKDFALPSDNQGNQFSTKNVADTTDQFLAESPAYQGILDANTLRLLAIYYRAKRTGTKLAKRAERRKKEEAKVPLIAKAKLSIDVTPEDKIRAQKIGEARGKANALAKSKKEKAHAEFLQKQGSLV